MVEDLLQIGASVITNRGSFIITYRGKVLLQIGAASFITYRGRFITYRGRYYKSGQVLLQIGAGITNRGKYYYKSGQVLQIGAIITNRCTTDGDPKGLPKKNKIIFVSTK